MRLERRKRMRHKVRDGLYACAVPEFLRVGGIVDINMNGLSFKYIKTENRPKRLTEMVVLEIFDRERKFHLAGIPFKPSYDEPHGRPNSMVSAFMRRLGGRFVGISYDQRDQLRRLISEYTASVERQEEPGK